MHLLTPYYSTNQSEIPKSGKKKKPMDSLQKSWFFQGSKPLKYVWKAHKKIYSEALDDPW